MSGKVWLVGAGPGDAGLLTRKGEQVLRQADVVVYDALVGQGVLNLIPDSARLIYAGKRSGNHFLKQSETNRVLLDEARKGNKVVRLKGGDPFVFGRGGEELELLSKHGIPFEVVPGVTSAFAVPAYNGIPVTHRDYCSSVHIITGHRRKDQTYDIDFDALVKTGGTLVFLMGIAAMPDICAGLLRAGIDPDTPAAVLERGTTSQQHRISATVGALEEVCSRTEVLTPAIIVVGDVCSLADSFSWFEKRPLANVKVLVTRPRELSSRMAAMLRDKGAEVLELPAICTRPVADDGPVLRGIETLENGGFDWIVFTSPSGVKIFFDKLMETSDIRAFAGVKVAAMGRGTQKELRKYGLKADFVPSVYDAVTLGKEMAEMCEPGARIFIPRASIGNPELIRGLETGRELKVTEVATYDTVYVSSRVIDEKELFESGEIDFAVFTSASTVKGFAAGVGEMDMSKVNAVCIGAQTQKEALALGMKTWVAERATMDSLLKKVEEAAAEIKAAR